MIRKWTPWNLALTGAAVLVATGAAGWAALAAEKPQTETAPVASVGPQTPEASSGLYVYLDEHGNKISRPANAPIPAAPAQAEKTGAPTKVAIKGGGWKVDLSHIRVYEHATVGADGKVSTDCETRHDAVKH